MATIGRHRASSSFWWVPVIVSAALSVTLGAGISIVTGSEPDPDAAPGLAQAAPDIAPAAAQAGAPAAAAASVVRPAGSVGFGDSITGPGGLSMTVLPPEKIKGGVRLTTALVNHTDTPLIVEISEVGPHDIRFDGAAISVPGPRPSGQKKLMPGHGYAYQCDIPLPTMDVGQLELTLGSVPVTGQAAGD